MITVEMVREKGFEFVAQDVVNVSYPENEPDYQIIENRFLCVVNDKIPPWHDCDVKKFAWRDNKGEMPCDGNLWVDVELRRGGVITEIASELYWLVDTMRDDDITKWRPSLKNWESEMNLDKIETQEEKEAFDIMTQDNEKLQNHEIGNGSEIHNDLDWEKVGLPPVGTECEFKLKVDGDEYFSPCYIVGIRRGAQTPTDVLLVFSDKYDNLHQHNCKQGAFEFRKQEAPKRKHEREQLEAAYDLYGAMCDYDEFAMLTYCQFKESDYLNGWLKVVDKTGYRKQNG